MNDTPEPSEPSTASGADRSMPDGATARRRPRRRVVRQGTERETVMGQTADDRAGHDDKDDNDDRLLRDVPPHWGRR
ncbi:hypothetical protein [Isoptericola sp. NPDC057191]|uniref:hypothetical protein n=1 Tax=Isoptericola sp. NPDC057191 TaxID=3346041 RepID=UPI003635856E